MSEFGWQIKHKRTGLKLSGTYTQSKNNADEIWKHYITNMLMDFKNFIGYGEDDDYEITITKN
tara:strand:+ start:491 stop:679 length:189 start_codon:yes stop_codon:yes gene_type:complete